MVPFRPSAIVVAENNEVLQQELLQPPSVRQSLQPASYRILAVLTRRLIGMRQSSLPSLESRQQESCGFPGTASAYQQLRWHGSVSHRQLQLAYVTLPTLN